MLLATIKLDELRVKNVYKKNCGTKNEIVEQNLYFLRDLSHQARNQEVIHYNEDTISRAHKINANSEFFILFFALIAGSRFQTDYRTKKIKLCKC
jgi:hypothetical protein